MREAAPYGSHSPECGPVADFPLASEGLNWPKGVSATTLNVGHTFTGFDSPCGMPAPPGIRMVTQFVRPAFSRDRRAASSFTTRLTTVLEAGSRTVPAPLSRQSPCVWCPCYSGLSAPSSVGRRLALLVPRTSLCERDSIVGAKPLRHKDFSYVVAPTPRASHQSFSSVSNGSK